MAQFDDAVERLRERILSGRLAAGDKLGAEEIAVELGMSRSPVREAFRVLAGEGLVELTANRGARVSAWSDDEIDSMFEVRILLEGLAVRRAASRATQEDADHLDSLATRIAELAAPGPGRDLQAVQRLNSEFHGGIIRIAGSTTLANAMAGVIHAAVLARTQDSYDDEGLRRSSNHHLEIVAAIRAGDDRWAEDTMRSHLLSARASLLGPRRALPSAGDGADDERAAG